MWENRHFTKLDRFKKGMLYILILIGYLLFCTFAVLIIKFLLAQVKFHYYFGPTCPEISAMFSNDQDYLDYATFD
jgi:hypothetical protein